MKLDCNRALLAAACSAASSVIPNKPIQPLLGNILLTVTDGTATLTATDSEVTLVHSVSDVTADGDGKLLLPAKRVSEILKEMRDERVNVVTDKNTIRLRGDFSEFKLPIADPAEFPSNPIFVPERCIEVSGSMLRTMIRRTVFATDPDSGRYALGGVLFDASDIKSVLRLAATDGRRMSVISAPFTQKGDWSAGAVKSVIPPKALSLLGKTVPESNELVSVALLEASAIFATEKTKIWTRLVEGRFPAYLDVIPKAFDLSIDLLAGGLHSIVRQAVILTSEESRGVDFEFSKGKLTLRSQAADVGASEIKMPVSYDGDEVSIRLDPRFVSDFINCLAPETSVTLRMTDEDNPLTLSTPDGSMYLIVPIVRENS